MNQTSFKDDVMSIFSAAITPVVPERKTRYNYNLDLVDNHTSLQ